MLMVVVIIAVAAVLLFFMMRRKPAGVPPATAPVEGPGTPLAEQGGPQNSYPPGPQQ